MELTAGFLLPPFQGLFFFGVFYPGLRALSGHLPPG